MVTLGILVDSTVTGPINEISRKLGNVPGIRGLPASTKSLVVQMLVDGFVGGGKQGFVDTIADSMTDALVGPDWRN